MSILIAGGGIGGLSLALALQQAGIKVQVFEQASTIQAVGAGLTLWPNAVRALQELGLEKALRSKGMAYTQATIRSQHGSILSETPVMNMIERTGITPLAIHRADLQAILLSALGEEVLHIGSRVQGFQQQQKGVSLHFANGDYKYGDFLIGADGIHSVIRTQLFGEQSLRFAGYTTWRAIAHVQATEPLFESWGQGQRFGYVPLTQGRVYWFATKDTLVGSSVGQNERKQTLRTWFEQWHNPIPTIFEATEGETILRNDIYDLSPLSQWGKGRVTLLGDAAHAMTPDLGQGAAQALEDTLVLMQCLRHFGRTEEALRVYEQRRIRRVNPLMRQSRFYGWVAQWKHSFSSSIRSLLMRSPVAHRQMKQLEDTFAYDVSRETFPK